MQYMVMIRQLEQVDWVLEHYPLAINQYARMLSKETGTWACIFSDEEYTHFMLRWQ